MNFEAIMNQYFNWVAYGTLVLAVPVFLLLFFVRAPYGRHIRTGWGPLLENRLGWFIMESPAVLVFGVIVVVYAKLNVTALLLLLMWESHYVHRAFIYPWTLKKGKKMPWSIVLMAIVFNITNGYLNGWSIATHADRYADAWVASPQFVIGVLVFFSGMALNKVSDRQLALLGRSGDGQAGYRVPHGLAFRWVSCPNYLGEIVQWTGWAIATWSLAGWVFAIWTLANLAPRALAHHRWYRETFADYPPARRALVPYLF